MRRVAPLIALLLLGGCAAEEPAPEAPPPPPPTFADFGGRWNVVNNLEGIADSVPSQLEGNPDGTGWVMHLEGRDPIRMRAALHGDSLVLLSAPYPSILRENVTVTVLSASVLVDGALVGKLVATYDYPDSQQVVTGTLRGTRAP